MIKLASTFGLSTEKDIDFHELRGFEVIDANNKEIGKIEDAILSLKDFSILALITYKGYLEEKLEEIGLRENHSIIVPSEVIFKMDEEKRKIILRVTKEEILSTIGDYNFSNSSIQFSRFRKMPVFLSDMEQIGYVLSILFTSDGTNILIVGGEELNLFLKQQEKTTNFCLKVPKDSIVKLTNAVCTNLNKHNIIDALNNSTKYMELYLSYAAPGSSVVTTKKWAPD